MMLHENSLKSIMIERIKNYTTSYTSVLETNLLYFDKPKDKYIGVKNHHGHPFLFDEKNTITYPRGIHSKVVMDVYLSLKDRNVYTKKNVEGLTYTVRPKKNK
jgi:hypothetical protein